MSIDRYDTDDWSRPLLPSALESYLVRSALRALGAVLVVLGLAGAIALLAWRVPDLLRMSPIPGGPTGVWSIAGGMLLSGFGIAAVVVVAAPLAWGIELVSRAELSRARMKLAVFPLAAALLAGGAATFPTPSGWPMTHGLGGSVGTIVLALTAFVAAWVSPRDAIWISGLVLLAAGAASLTHAIGLTVREIARALVPLEPGRLLRLGWSHGQNWSTRHPTGLRSLARRVTSRLEPEGPRLDPQPGRAVVPASRYGPYAPPEPFDPLRDPDDDLLEPLEPWPLPERAPTPAPTPDVPARGTSGDARSAADPPMTPTPPPDDPLADPPFEIYRGDGVDGDVQRLEGQRLAEKFAPFRGDSEPVVDTALASPLGRVGALVLGTSAEPVYRRPALTVLGRSTATRLAPPLAQAAVRGTARMLQDVLAEFGVDGTVLSMRQGPVVTVFEFDPATGVRLDRLLALAPEIARAIGSGPVRVAPLAGRPSVTIEVPNSSRETISVRDILETPQFRQPGLALPVAAGRTLTGEPVVLDLARLPHALVIGSPAAPPKGALDLVVLSRIFSHTPGECELVLIDPRVADLSVYTGLPHLVMPVVTQPARALAALDWVVAETEERTKRLALLNVRSLDVYNNRVRNARKRGELNRRTVQTGYDPGTGRRIFEHETIDAKPLPYLVVLIGDLADILIADRHAVATALQRIARVGQSVGVHIVAATDRPGADVLSPEIDRVFPSRLAFKLPTRQASVLALGFEGAEQLLAGSDMLVRDALGTVARIHAAVASEADIEAAVGAVRQASAPVASDDPTELVMEPTRALAPDRGGVDDLYDRAVAAVVRERRAEPDVLQRRLRIDRHHALDLLERMHREGLRLP